MEEKLKEFILNDMDFFDLAKKYTFIYREFSPFNDYLELLWDRKEKKWEFAGEGYYCHNQNEAFPQNKNTLFLNLCIEGYNWGTLFNKMEEEFSENLKTDMTEEEINDLNENHYDRYTELRDEFFKLNKKTIVDNWFELKEEEIQNYLQIQFQGLKEMVLVKKSITY